ncbi:hypothetical protein DA075_27660 [Methylobacterium currus]|uniref:Uncharacterized protein n=1 Tax=Methylobacterium currus TaxID=2051553 RepID=A0A2R4WRM3_9HYPH|nr:hypothetical protein [Methylobacterium currus]AWB24190.1 hypothetical protein DA075_27660 [Methylobacterium currus]
MGDHHHPETPVERSPTEAMMAVLRQVVATNGGGLSPSGIPHSILKGLVARHLVQGKAGAPSRVVHTKLGLKLVREEAARTTPANIDSLPETAGGGRA